MKYLKSSDAFKDKFSTELAERTQRELKSALREYLRPFLNDRRVEFQDAMGSMSVMIEHRRGGFYVITTSDVYWSPKGPQVRGYTYVDEKTCPWLKVLQAMLMEYDKISDRLFAIEFSFYIGDKR